MYDNQRVTIYVKGKTEKTAKSTGKVYTSIHTDIGWLVCFRASESNKLEQFKSYEVEWTPDKDRQGSGVLQRVLSELAAPVQQEGPASPGEGQQGMLPGMAAAGHAASPAPSPTVTSGSGPMRTTEPPPVQNKWDVKDNRISRLSCLSSAAELIAAKMAASPAYTASALTSLCEDTLMIAETFMEYVYGVPGDALHATSSPDSVPAMVEDRPFMDPQPPAPLTRVGGPALATPVNTAPLSAAATSTPAPMVSTPPVTRPATDAPGGANHSSLFKGQAAGHLDDKVKQILEKIKKKGVESGPASEANSAPSTPQ